MEQKKFWLNDMEAVLGIVAMLIIMGTINIFSSSFILSETNYGTPYFFLQRHIINICIGILCFVLGCKVDYHKWRKIMPWVVSVTLLALVLVLVIGVSVNGSKRWLNIFIMPVQPAEWAKLVSIMLMAAYISSQLSQVRRISLFSLQGGVIILMGGLVEMEPDMGTACMVVGVPLLMMMLSGLGKATNVSLAGLAMAAGAALCVWQPYRLERIKVLLDPWADAQNVGYQVVQSLSAIGSGGFGGMGLGMGISKYEYLPEAHTDFAFAVFCQENGFFGACIILLLFAALAYYCARIANKACDSFGQMLAMGIMFLLVGQAIINLLMVGGIFPVVGVPLPFISYGGTSLIVSLAGVGILINIGAKATSQAGLQRMAQPEELSGLRLVKK